MGILGVILALIAIVCAVLVSFVFGTTGGIIAGVLALVAIVLGVLKRRKDHKGGIAAIVLGTLAVILALALTSAWSSMFAALHQKAVEYKPDGLWAQVSDNPNGGLMGIIKNLPEDEATMNALVDEMNELNQITDAQ